MPGQHPGGIIATMLLGIIGAWLGGLIGRALHLYAPGHPAGFVMAVIGAAVVLVIYGYFTRPAATNALRYTPPQHLTVANPASSRPVIIRA